MYGFHSQHGTVKKESGRWRPGLRRRAKTTRINYNNIKHFFLVVSDPVDIPGVKEEIPLPEILRPEPVVIHITPPPTPNKVTRTSTILEHFKTIK